MGNLKKILDARGRTQSWLAGEMNLTEATISRYINNIRAPNQETLRRMAALLHCEPEEIGGEQPLMTDDERRSPEAFRRIPEGKRRAYWAMVDALADISTPATDDVPDRKESD